MSKLVLYLPDGTTLDIPLTRERTTIGRRANNDVCLPNLAVSGEHAVVVTILDDSFLEDFNSTNGTLVNGNAIAKHFLRDRDQIEIGHHKLVYCAEDDAKLEPEIPSGMARISVRDFGARVESATPFVRSRQTAGAPPSPTADAAPSKPASAVAPAVAPLPARAVAAEPSSAPPPPKATPAPEPEAAETPADSPSIRLLSGPQAGTLLALTKAETTLGRPGIQVAIIARTSTGFCLKPLEGALPPTVNGKPVEREGIELKHGDVLGLAGKTVEFVDPQHAANREDVAA